MKQPEYYVRVCRDDSCGTGSAYNHASGAGGGTHTTTDSDPVRCEPADGVSGIRTDQSSRADLFRAWGVASTRGGRVMPRRVGRPCKAPGCPEVVTEGAWCPSHRPKDVDARPSRSRRGYTRTWQKIRASHLARYPLCVACRAEGRTTAATEVDHITPLARGGTHAAANLQSLCKSCHSRKTRNEMGMGG